MAVLLKQGGRKPVVVGGISVGYGNFYEEGLPEQQHLKIRISDIESDFKPHTLSLTFKEAEQLLTYLGYYLVGHSEVTIDDLNINMLKVIKADELRFGPKKESHDV